MVNESAIEKDWNHICSDVASRMREYVLPFSTPVSRALEYEYGEHHGSASYLQTANQRFLLSNEHVARAATECSSTHKFWGCEDIFRVANAWVTVAAPVDVSVSIVDDRTWSHSSHEAQCVHVDKFAEKHDPVERELLFFAGYSGDRSDFHFGYLFTAGTPYLSQEIPIPNGIPEADEMFHFALPYKPDSAVSVDGSSSLPTPPGFSGSVVWDTKRVACLESGEEWSPDLAQVTGLVWGWPSSKACILATKVECMHIHELLKLAGKYA